MKLYLLNILQTNTVDEVKGLKSLFDEYKGKFNLYQSSIEDAQKYLVQLTFTNPEDRENLADRMPHIAFEFSSIDYDDELYKKALNGEIKVNYYEKPEKYRPNKFELKVDSYFERKEIKFDKTYQEFVCYEFELANGKKGMINLDYKGKWLQGAVEGCNMIVTQQKKFMDTALARLIQEIEDANK